jgi:hypothetical protein
MRNRGRRIRSFLLWIVALSCIGALPAIAAPAPGSAGRKRPAAQDDEWPKPIHMGEATAYLDAPQAESLDGTKLKAHGTFRLERSPAAEPVFGSIWYDADVAIDREQRRVTLANVTVTRVQLPGAPPARQQRMATHFSQAVTRLQPKLALDDILAQSRIAKGQGQAPPKLNTEPPKILFESEPAILIVFDGEPRFKSVEGTRLERALNTPFLVLHDTGSNAFYLDGGTTWFRASSPTGPWSKTGDVPREATDIASRDLKDAGISDKEVKEAGQSADKRVPKILVATEPTELIVSDGSPRWSPEVAGELEGLANSESDVFRTLSDQQIFVALSGRWYKSGSLTGPWTYVEPDRLPESFHRISADSEKAEVLAFVPGTAPAREAVADANTPRTAAIRRGDAHVSVTYDGEPRFESVPGTHVEYALNTPDQVLRIGGRYYVCDQGVWFTSAAATGPWVVADAIPDDDIQAIPPESPVYNTRYAYVYDSTPDVVYTAYTPAYLGSYPYYGTVVFGTGWFYRPWWGAFYYPRPWTWGFHARFAGLGGWGWGFGWGPAWGGFRYGFGFGWGARWCGPGAFFRPAFRNVNITRNVNVTRNIYRSGANASRATMTRTTTTRATTTRTAGARTTSRTTTASKQTTSHAAHSGQSPHGGQAKARGASPQGAKAKAPKAHAAGHGGKGGGKKH